MAPPAGAADRFKVSPGVRFLGGLGGVVIIAICYYFFRYSVLSKQLKVAKDKSAQLDNDKLSAETAYRAYIDDRIVLEGKRARARELNKVLPEGGEIASFLASVNQQAEVAGLKVKQVVPLEEQAQQFFTRVPVRLSVSGRFHQLAKFFAGIGRLDRVINVENIEMTNPKVGDNEETTIQAGCLTTTFHGNAAASASALPQGARK